MVLLLLAGCWLDLWLDPCVELTLALVWTRSVYKVHSPSSCMSLASHQNGWSSWHLSWPWLWFSRFALLLTVGEGKVMLLGSDMTEQLNWTELTVLGKIRIYPWWHRRALPLGTPRVLLSLALLSAGSQLALHDCSTPAANQLCLLRVHLPCNCQRDCSKTQSWNSLALVWKPFF